MYSHTTYYVQNSFIAPNWNLFPVHKNSLYPSAPSPWWLPFYFLSLWIWLFQIPHVSEIIQYLSFCIFISRQIMSSSSIQIMSFMWQCILECHFFFRLNNISVYVCEWVYLISCLSIHLSMDTWVALTFWLWIWVNKSLFKCLLSILLGI